MSQHQLVLKAAALNKRLNSNFSITGVNVEFIDGKIYGIVGKRASGKSALTKLLSGHLTPDSGWIHVNNGVVALNSPHEARIQGIARLTEKSSLFYELTALENLILGTKLLGHGDQSLLVEEIRRQMESFNCRFDPNKKVASMTTLERCRVELFRLLWRNTRVFILDNWTSQLTQEEAAEFLPRLKDLASTGHIVIMVGSNPAQIAEFCDHLVIMQDGRVTEELNGSQSVFTVSTYVDTEPSTSPVKIAEIATDEVIEINSPANPLKAAAGYALSSVFSALLAIGLAVGVVFLVHGNLIETCQSALTSAFGSTQISLNTLFGPAVVITFCALAVAIAAWARQINMGAQGQLLAGAVGASAIPILMPHESSMVLLPMMALSACTCGAVWGLAAIVLKNWLKIHEAFSSLILNYFAILGVGYLASGPWHDPSTTAATTSPLPAAAQLQNLPGCKADTELFIAVGAVVITALIAYSIKNRGALHLIGHFNSYSISPISKKTIVAFLAAGAIAGMGGFCQIAAIDSQLRPSICPNIGYIGFIACWLGRSNPLTIALSTILFGILDVGVEAFHVLDGMPFGANLAVPGIMLIATMFIDSIVSKTWGKSSRTILLMQNNGVSGRQQELTGVGTK